MRKALHILLFLISVTVATTAAPHLTRTYTYRHFTTRDGLAQMQLMCAFQDKDGYLWFGTKGGVSRWDGVTFKNYTTENGLPLGEILNISEWGNQKVFMTFRKMIILFENDSILVQDLPDKMKFPGSGQRTIVVDNDNILLFGLVESAHEYQENFTYHYQYNLKTRKFSRFTNFNESVIQISDNKIIGTNYVYEWTGKNIRQFLRFPFKVRNALFNNDATKCALQYFKGSKLELFLVDKGKFRSLKRTIEKDIFRCTWLYDNSFLYVGMDSCGFFPERNVGLKNDFTFPNFSFVDHENNLWIGTENGLYNYFNLTIEEYNFGLGTPDNVWSVVEDNVGTVWIGSYGNGLYTLNKNGAIRFVDFGHGVIPNATGSNKLMYMGSTTDGNGTVYMTLGYGVSRFRNGKFSGCSVTHGGLYAYYDKQSGQIMYSGMDTVSNKRGLYIGMDRDKKFYPFDRGFPLCILRDASKRIRVGCFRGTAVLVNDSLVTDTMKRPYTGVVSMVMDNHNRIWKATEKGIYVELPNGSEQRVSPQYLTGIYTALALYKNKYLIAGGTNGFAIIDIAQLIDYKNLAVVNIGHDAGFTGLESGQNGILVDSNGDVWLTTAQNVLKFNPETIVKNTIIRIPKLRVVCISFSSDNSLWTTHYFSQGKAMLGSDKRFFKIEYVANSISAPQSLRFRYRMHGHSEQWSKVTYTKMVNYTNLPYGDYRFEVQCSMDGINWSSSAISPVFTLVRPWYLSYFMLFMYLMLFVVAVVNISRIRMKKQQAHKIELLNRKKVENELQLNTLRSKILPHFTKNVLSAIGHFAMTDKLKAGHYIAVFSRFTGLTLANADKNYVPIREEIEYILQYLELEKMRFGERFDYKLTVDDDVLTDTLIPTMVLHTYCDNAIRHGLVNKIGNGLLEVRIENEEAGIMISVTDNGIGRKRSAELGTHGNGQGLLLIESQLKFYNQFNTKSMWQTITDLSDENGTACGTRACLYIPWDYRFKYDMA